MPDTDRDPRVDPRPGDEVEVCEGTYKVIATDERSVKCESPPGYVQNFYLSTWKIVMAAARVVARGGEEKP